MKQYQSDDELVNDIEKLPQSYKLSSESRDNILSTIRNEYHQEFNQQLTRQDHSRTNFRFSRFKASFLSVVAILIVCVIGVTSWKMSVKPSPDSSATQPHSKSHVIQPNGHPDLNSKKMTTVDSKNTVSLQSLQSNIKALNMITAQVGWIQAGTQVLHTVNGGKTWQQVTPKKMPKTSAHNQVESKASFYDRDHAWITVSTIKGSQVFHTSNGGQSWQSSTLPTPKYSAGIDGPVTLSFSSTKEGWLMNSEGGAMGSEGVVLYHTMNQGKTWIKVTEAGPQNSVNNLIPFGGHKSGLSDYHQTLWLSGQDYGDQLYLYKSADGGKNWKRQNLPIPKGYTAQGGSANTMPPVFFNQNQGILPVQFHINGQANVFYVTQDGGQTWNMGTAVKSSSNKSMTYQIIDMQHLAVLDSKRLLLSPDQGQTWRTVQLTQAMDGIYFTNSSVGFGYRGKTLYKTTNGGLTWKQVKNVSTKP